jgi:hypothetical protein
VVLTGAATLMAALFAATLAPVALTGALPAPLLAAWPALAAMPAMAAGASLFFGGAAVLAILAYGAGRLILSQGRTVGSGGSAGT